MLVLQIILFGVLAFGVTAGSLNTYSGKRLF